MSVETVIEMAQMQTKQKWYLEQFSMQCVRIIICVCMCCSVATKCRTEENMHQHKTEERNEKRKKNAQKYAQQNIHRTFITIDG